MGKEKVTHKQGRELRAGDRIVCEDGETRVITAIGPGPFPATLSVSFQDGSDDLLPALVSFEAISDGPQEARKRMRAVSKKKDGA